MQEANNLLYPYQPRYFFTYDVINIYSLDVTKFQPVGKYGFVRASTFHSTPHYCSGVGGQKISDTNVSFLFEEGRFLPTAISHTIPNEIVSQALDPFNY